MSPTSFSQFSNPGSVKAPHQKERMRCEVKGRVRRPNDRALDQRPAPRDNLRLSLALEPFDEPQVLLCPVKHHMVDGGMAETLPEEPYLAV